MTSALKKNATYADLCAVPAKGSPKVRVEPFEANELELGALWA